MRLESHHQPPAAWLVRAVFAAAAVLLVGLALGLFLLHYLRDPTGSELLPLSSFIVLLSYSAHAMSWARVGGELEDPARLRDVYLGALLLFMASLFFLFSAVFVWLPAVLDPGFGVDFIFTYLHVILFGAALALSVGGLLLLLAVARRRFLARLARSNAPPP